MVWLSIHKYVFLLDVITIHTELEVGHGWVITLFHVDMITYPYAKLTAGSTNHR